MNEQMFSPKIVSESRPGFDKLPWTDGMNDSFRLLTNSYENASQSNHASQEAVLATYKTALEQVPPAYLPTSGSSSEIIAGYHEILTQICELIGRRDISSEERMQLIRLGLQTVNAMKEADSELSARSFQQYMASKALDYNHMTQLANLAAAKDTENKQFCMMQQNSTDDTVCKLVTASVGLGAAALIGGPVGAVCAIGAMLSSILDDL